MSFLRFAESLILHEHLLPDLNQSVFDHYLKLNLNLTQCQALNFHLNEIKHMIEKSEDGKIQIGAVAPLLPFLELFKDIQNPMDPNLWNNDIE